MIQSIDIHKLQLNVQSPPSKNVSGTDNVSRVFLSILNSFSPSHQKFFFKGFVSYNEKPYRVQGGISPNSIDVILKSVQKRTTYSFNLLSSMLSVNNLIASSNQHKKFLIIMRALSESVISKSVHFFFKVK